MREIDQESYRRRKLEAAENIDITPRSFPDAFGRYWYYDHAGRLQESTSPALSAEIYRTREELDKVGSELLTAYVESPIGRLNIAVGRVLGAAIGVARAWIREKVR